MENWQTRVNIELMEGASAPSIVGPDSYAYIGGGRAHVCVEGENAAPMLREVVYERVPLEDARPMNKAIDRLDTGGWFDKLGAGRVRLRVTGLSDFAQRWYSTNRAFGDADEEWSLELRKVYGDDACNARYDRTRNASTPELARLHAKRELRQAQWHGVLEESRDGS